MIGLISFVFLACFLAPIDCRGTLITVPFTLACRTNFYFTISLMEIDGGINPNDELARFSGGKDLSGQNFDGIIGGEDFNDWGDEYELRLVIVHNCRGEWKTTEWNLDPVMVCLVKKDRCDYPKQVVNL